ncbi:MAG: hypothetical protein QOE45_1717 [Frankiaceae bacterium]|jgi:hypothetical protein|nr:hypothetical protein [Frankiaceae bacterium]
MRHLVTRTSVVVGLATALLTPAMPAQATSGVTFTADIVVDGLGSGGHTGEAWLCVSGVVGGTVVTCAGGYNAHATFTLVNSYPVCQAMGDAWGTVTGAVQTSFTWVRVGDTAFITTSGGSLGSGNGTATFTVTSPVGIPCGQTVRATAEGSVWAP